MMYSDIQKANEAIRSIKVGDKDYAEVNQRIKAFRMVYPEGFILTEMVTNENGVCVFRAKAGYYDLANGEPVILATGTAYEKEGSSFINKTSYIENCETSAVGRCLGLLGFGIDTSVASAEEVQNAKLQQEQDKPEASERKAEMGERKASPKQVEIIKKNYTGANLQKLLDKLEITAIEELPMQKASDIIKALMEVKK